MPTARKVQEEDNECSPAAHSQCTECQSLNLLVFVMIVRLRRKQIVCKYNASPTARK